MGTTCASVHIPFSGTTADAIKGVVRAYARLGFERAKTAPAEGGKHVILLRKDADPFLSLYDSDNATLDTGELKELALAASKIFKTAAICTSLYDSDTFEVVVFNAGKQVDLVMSNPEEYGGPLKILSGRTRAAQWSKVFGKTLSAETIARAIATESAFADDTVAELSRLIGLTGGQSQLHYQDFREDETAAAHLHFSKASAPRALAEGQVALRNYFDPDNSRMLLVYPASWPVALSEDVLVTWLMLSEGAGFDGGTLTIRVDGPDGLAIAHGYLDGAKFHNGQIVGPLETAPRQTTPVTVDEELKRKQFAVTPGPVESAQSNVFTARFPAALTIPTKAPDRPTQILLILQLQVVASRTGTWNLDVSVQPSSQNGFEHRLPRARLAAVDQTWLPVVSGLNPKASYDTSDLAALQPRGPLLLHEVRHKQTQILRDRRLDHFAIASNTAIVEDAGQPALDACRSFLEAWLRPLAEQTGDIRLHAEKRMTPRAYVGKSQKTLPLSDVHGDRAWQKLFDQAGNYQTVLATIWPKDAEYPIAGVGLQAGLEQYPEQWREHGEQRLADTLSRMRGRPFDRAPVAPTFHVFSWILNHADCYGYLRTSIEDMKDRVDDFAARHAVLQAWHSQATWRPLFDHADSYERTVYEDNSVLNWFRGILQNDGGLDASKMSLQWCRHVVRMVAPHMWLGRTLIDQVDRAALERVAHVTEINGACRMVLRDGQALDDLELALLPILPVESVRLRTSA